MEIYHCCRKFKNFGHLRTRFNIGKLLNASPEEMDYLPSCLDIKSTKLGQTILVIVTQNDLNFHLR